MKKQTVFIKRYPSKGELPKEDDKDYCSNVGMVYFRKLKFYFRDEQVITFTDKVEWWLEKLELPSEDCITENIKIPFSWGSPLKDALYRKGIDNCYEFILNKLKGETKQ